MKYHCIVLYGGEIYIYIYIYRERERERERKKEREKEREKDDILDRPTKSQGSLGI